MASENEKIPPHIRDERPWAQGFIDWLAFGDEADAFSAEMIGFRDYCRGKAEAKTWFHGNNINLNGR